MRGGRPLLSFAATWYCTDRPRAGVGPRARPAGGSSVVGDAPLTSRCVSPSRWRSMGECTPGYTANRAVNAVPFVCEAAPGIRTTRRPAPDHRHPAGRCPSMAAGPMRPLPELTPATEWFWTSGADGRLRIQGCTECSTRSSIHPCPSARCAGAGASEPTVVSGRATIVGYTVNQHQWSPRLRAALRASPWWRWPRTPRVRLTTTIVGCDPGRGGHRPGGDRPLRAPRGRVAAPLRADR